MQHYDSKDVKKILFFFVFPSISAEKELLGVFSRAARENNLGVPFLRKILEKNRARSARKELLCVFLRKKRLLRKNAFSLKFLAGAF